MFDAVIAPLLQMRALSRDEASQLMEFLMSGDSTQAQTASVLTALRLKGVEGSELAAFAEILRKHSKAVDAPDGVVDTCGTGGGIPSFNISTAAAFVAAGAGAFVAKHGNRKVTSACGSADVLEALGVQIPIAEERIGPVLRSAGIAFMFAPAHHPAMRHVGPTRQELKFRTVFNQLGPLANPAGAKRQLIGVYEVSLLRPMADALSELGVERAIVAHGAEGLDEISPCGRTYVAIVEDGKVSLTAMQPSDFGLEEERTEVLSPGADVGENAAILREAISDVGSPRAKAVLPSAAATIWLAGLATDLKEAKSLAEESIRSGAAAQRLERLIEESRG